MGKTRCLIDTISKVLNVAFNLLNLCIVGLSSTLGCLIHGYLNKTSPQEVVW
jgi:hypothetical protein